MWEIIDSKGTIESGTEEEMLIIWHNTINSGKSPRIINWIGDLKLVHIIAIHN